MHTFESTQTQLTTWADRLYTHANGYVYTNMQVSLTTEMELQDPFCDLYQIGRLGNVRNRDSQYLELPGGASQILKLLQAIDELTFISCM